MIKFFRRIRQDLLKEGKTSKYFKYAIGEIVLVVIGILIALWINNMNQDFRQNKEQEKLVLSLEQELTENLKELNKHKAYLINCRLDLINVLNFSAGTDETMSADSLRMYTSRMIALNAININTSTLNNYKASGKINLLDEKLTELITVYETALANFYKTEEGDIGLMNKENNELLLNFSSLKKYENFLHPDSPILKHPDYKKSD
tara:strand:- start:63830 stop:64444 length:615 start_codon:yes stop_codon:yes gene_type:complete